ncbi:NADH:flavin oxidoreductase/NADH oxidase [Agromyces albus]|uniref:NADH:flavin oxidoreductase/NADH oxidase n=1 Tax=Agromyces albus TaxID=205332 RepID=UPI00278B52C7|nr:NADH:flavin oxidoreductase/NADH oxidase [Agromyces albus]MDQ0577234.1 2,4-dienoyl-CoA reductase-like NADH-dependent reductase (Old Yellow Enzyme family) [Agromyces albus]
MTTPFTPLRLRDLDISNRLWMSPMCTYSANATGPATGSPTDFHLAQYTARAAGGAGLVMIEATGVRADGRISPYDLGLWDDTQTAAFTRLAASITAAGAVPAIQLAHAGRKASVDKPWLGGSPLDETQNGWPIVGPSETAFPGYPAPAELSVTEIADIVDAFAQAATRALQARFQVVEVHAAHGYLLHSFLSPASNTRTDNFGGSFNNRIRFPLEVIDAVRAVWPEDRPVFLRVSTTDWIQENPADERTGWTVEETIEFSRLAAEHGVDLVDSSSGGTEPAPIPRERDYQTRNAARIRTETALPVAAVGRINDAVWAAELIADGHADALFLGRPLLRDASWINNAATTLGAQPRYIEQYDYAL